MQTRSKLRKYPQSQPQAQTYLQTLQTRLHDPEQTLHRLYDTQMQQIDKSGKNPHSNMSKLEIQKKMTKLKRKDCDKSNNVIVNNYQSLQDIKIILQNANSVHKSGSSSSSEGINSIKQKQINNHDSKQDANTYQTSTKETNLQITVQPEQAAKSTPKYHKKSTKLKQILNRCVYFKIKEQPLLRIRNGKLVTEINNQVKDWRFLNISQRRSVLQELQQLFPFDKI